MCLVADCQAAFGSLTTPPEPRKVRDLITEIRPSSPDVAPYRRAHGNFPYGWKSVFRSQHLLGAVLTWAGHDACAIHDHGASWAWVYVIEGDAYHAVYKLTGQGVPVLHKEKTERQGKLVFIPRGVVHVMGNPSSEPLVTFHVYAPPIQG